MKILCVCEHGNVRSVALAYLLKTIYGYDVLACGVRETSDETKKMLWNWADKVIALQDGLLEQMPRTTEDFKKGYVLDVGDDIWHDPYAQELIHKCLKGLKTLDLTNIS